jgi:hypothetical protein
LCKVILHSLKSVIALFPPNTSLCFYQNQVLGL